MLIEKKIGVTLTVQEIKVLSDCEEVIDKFLDKMEELNLNGYTTEYDYFTDDDLIELAAKIHSLRTVNEAD